MYWIKAEEQKQANIHWTNIEGRNSDIVYWPDSYEGTGQVTSHMVKGSVIGEGPRSIYFNFNKLTLFYEDSDFCMQILCIILKNPHTQE